MWFFLNNMQICVTTVCILVECSKTVSRKSSKKLWIRNSNKYTWYRWNSLKSKTAYLLLHHYSSDCSLDHVGPVETVHAVDSEDALLLTDDSSLVHPVSSSSSRWFLGLYILICYYGGLQKTNYLCLLLLLYKIPISFALTDTYQAHFMSEMISEMASVSIWTFSNFIPRLRHRIQEQRECKGLLT